MVAYSLVSRRLGPAVVLLSLLAVPALAAGSQPAPRFQLSGSGSVSAAAAAQSAGDLHLRATLSPVNAAPLVQTGVAYTLSGNLAVVPLVCFNDTIFRNGFEAY